MKKIFIPYNTVRDNALKLAAQIYKDGFIPDIIYLPLRGGAYMGNVMSEFFKIVLKDSRPVFYAAVVARSYQNIREQDEIMIDGWTYDPEHLRNGDKVLFIDDIFDSGRTLNYLVDVILRRGIPRKDVAVAVHDYKVIGYKKQEKRIQPDYWCNKYTIDSEDEDLWIHYLSHELIGLNKEEVQNYFLKENPGLAEAFKLMGKI